MFYYKNKNSKLKIGSTVVEEDLIRLLDESRTDIGSIPDNTIPLFCFNEEKEIVAVIFKNQDAVNRIKYMPQTDKKAVMEEIQEWAKMTNTKISVAAE